MAGQRFPHLTAASQTAAGSATLVSGPATIHGIYLGSTGAAAVSVIIRDGGAGGDIVFQLGIPQYACLPVNLGGGYIACGTDVYITVAGAGGFATILYADRN